MVARFLSTAKTDIAPTEKTCFDVERILVHELCMSKIVISLLIAHFLRYVYSIKYININNVKLYQVQLMIYAYRVNYYNI